MLDAIEDFEELVIIAVDDLINKYQKLIAKNCNAAFYQSRIKRLEKIKTKMLEGI